MSIINEALKKTQSKLALRNSFQSPRPKSTGDLPKLSKNNTNTPLVILLVCILAGGTLLFFGSKLGIRISFINTSSALPSQSMSTSSSAKLPSRQDIILSGTIMAGEEASLLINDEILREGDEIAGMKIMKIHPNKVELSNTSGETVIIKQGR